MLKGSPRSSAFRVKDRKFETVPRLMASKSRPTPDTDVASHSTPTTPHQRKSGEMHKPPSFPQIESVNVTTMLDNAATLIAAKMRNYEAEEA